MKTLQRHSKMFMLLLCLLLTALGSACAGQAQPEQISPISQTYESVQPGAAAAPAAEAAAPGFQEGGEIERKVIARASIQLVVDETEQVVEQIQRLLDEVGGYVANANLYKDAYSSDARLQGTLTLRVPAAELEAFIAQVETLAVDVNNKTINREDVTDQYSDIDAQLRNLEATEVELREMLAEVRAKPNAKPEDILTVYNHLITIRGQIEQLQGRKNMLNNLVAFSTLEVTLTPNIVTLPVVEEGWQPVAVVREAARALVDTLQVLGNVAIWGGIYLLPILLIMLTGVAIFFLIVRILWRRLARRSRPAVG